MSPERDDLKDLKAALAAAPPPADEAKARALAQPGSLEVVPATVNVAPLFNPVAVNEPTAGHVRLAGVLVLSTVNGTATV